MLLLIHYLTIQHSSTPPTNTTFNKEQLDQIHAFETSASACKYSMCDSCKIVKLSMSTKMHGDFSLCKQCYDNKRKPTDFPHPVWIGDDNTMRFDIPRELEDLREGEKLLIQQVSPYVPLHHLQQGSYGSKGHVCSFPQDINHICNVLPRTPTDVSVVKVVKEFSNREGNTQCLTFRIRRNKVLEALRWLKKYNTEYHHIDICEDNFDWMHSPEQDLPHPQQEPQEFQQQESYVTYGENEQQSNAVPGTFGYIATPKNRNLPKAKDTTTTETLHSAYDSSNTSTSIDFPYVAQKAVNEYDKTSKLFCKAFPWLFPGGRGDFNDYSEVKETIDDWMRRLLYYQDGRFAADKMWAFFALNYSVRKKNMDSGAYFVNGFFDDGPQTLEELQDCIKEGDIGWINRLAYFSYHVKASPGYWRFKRSEVYSWINHHIQCGHGAPTLFITLSCAEYHWKDIKKLVEQRLAIAGKDYDCEDKKYIQLVNDYTLIVQEYFQQRVALWLKTIGKHLFGIQHHWLRYEFAPGRGQIHAHMLAITDHKHVFENSYKHKHDKEKQAEILATWATQTFGMTASVPDCDPDTFQPPHDQHPSTIHFIDIKNQDNDAMRCLVDLQYHKCNAKCMKKRKQRYVHEYLPTSM